MYNYGDPYHYYCRDTNLSNSRHRKMQIGLARIVIVIEHCLAASFPFNQIQNDEGFRLYKNGPVTDPLPTLFNSHEKALELIIEEHDGIYRINNNDCDPDGNYFGNVYT